MVSERELRVQPYNIGLTVPVGDIPGWTEDTDFWQTPPLDWPARLVHVRPVDLSSVVETELVFEYQHHYQHGGSFRLPPVVGFYDPRAMPDEEWVQITGAHRLTAAFLAELHSIPAWLAYDPTVTEPPRIDRYIGQTPFYNLAQW